MPYRHDARRAMIDDEDAREECAEEHPEDKAAERAQRRGRLGYRRDGDEERDDNPRGA